MKTLETNKNQLLLNLEQSLSRKSISEKEKSQSDQVSESTRADREKTVILVAEDDIHSLVFLKTLLILEGYEVIEATNGRIAVDAVQNHPEIRLVLIDMKMPELDGLEATRLIKKIRPNLPIVAQSAFAMNNDCEKAKEAGCDDYITKPVLKPVLMESIHRLIGIEKPLSNQG
jgi:CheY-like chemotaxis protein